MIKIEMSFGSAAMKKTGTMIQSELHLSRKKNDNTIHLGHCIFCYHKSR